MNLFDSHGEAPHPLQQQLIFDTSQAREEVKGFAETTVKSLREAEDEARKLGSELENLVQARLKFNGDKNRQRVQVVDPAGDAKFFTRIKLEEKIKELDQQYKKVLKTAQDMAREELEIGKIIEATRKANHLFTQDLEKNPQNIVKVKNAYTDLEHQIDRLSKIQVRTPTQEKYLQNLKNAYKLTSDEIEHLIDLEHRHAQAIQDAAEAERKRLVDSRATITAQRKAAEETERNAQALRAIHANPQIRHDKAFASEAERTLRESALRAAFNSREFEQTQIKLNVRGNLAENRQAIDSSGFNVNELEKQSRLRQQQQQREAEQLAKAEKTQSDALIKLRHEEAVKSRKAFETEESAARARELAQLREDILQRAALTQKGEQARFAAAIAERKRFESEEEALRKRQLEHLKADILERAKTEQNLEKAKYTQLIKDRKAFEEAEAAQRKKELERLKADIVARSKIQQQAAKEADDLAKRLAAKASSDAEKVAKATAKAAGKTQQAQQNRPTVIDKEIGTLTVQYLRAQKAAEALRKANNGISGKAFKDAQAVVAGYRDKLTAALREAKALGNQTANMSRAQAALAGAFDRSKSALGQFIDVTSKVGFALFGLQTALYAILAPLNAINQAFIQTNVRLEQAQLAIAATFQNNFVESFAKSMERAEDLVVKIRAEAVKTNLTFEDLQQAVSSNLSGLIARGANADQALEIISRVSQAAKIQLGARFDPSRVNDEIRALLNKQITGRTNETLLNLGITKADLKPLKDVSDLLDLIRKKTIGLDEANKVFTRTFQGSLDKLKDKLFEVSSIAGKPLFNELTKSLNDFSTELEKGTFDGLIAHLRDVGFLLYDIVKLFTTLANIGNIEIGLDIKLGDVLGPLIKGGLGFAAGKSLLSRVGFGSKVAGPAGAVIISWLNFFLENRKIDRINERRQAFDANPKAFSDNASLEDLQAQLRDLTVRKFRQMDNIKRDSANPAEAFQEAVRIEQDNLKKTLADMKVLEKAIGSRFFSIGKKRDESQRRFPKTGLGNSDADKTTLSPKSLIEGLPKPSEIEKITEKYNASIRDIENSNKELQGSLNAINPGGLVGLSQEIDSITKKMIANSQARTGVLKIIEDLTTETNTLESKFNVKNRTALDNPKEKKTVQEALILKDQFKNKQAQLKQAKEELAKLENQDTDFQAEKAGKQREKTDRIREQRIEIAGLTADIADLQSALSSNSVTQAFDKLATAVHRSNPEIKNLREEIQALEQDLLGVTEFGNGKTLVKAGVSLDAEQKVKLERLNFARLQLQRAESQQKVELGNLTLDAGGTLQSRAQQIMERLSTNRLFTQRERDSLALQINQEARSLIEEILKTGIAGGKDLKQDGLLPPEVKTQLETLRDQFETTTQEIKQAYTVNIVEAGKQAFDSFFDSILEGTVNFTQTFIGFFKDIARQMERILSTNIADRINQALFGGKGGFSFLSPKAASVDPVQSIPGTLGAMLTGEKADASEPVKQGVVGAYSVMAMPGGLFTKISQSGQRVPGSVLPSKIVSQKPFFGPVVTSNGPVDIAGNVAPGVSFAPDGVAPASGLLATTGKAFLGGSAALGSFQVGRTLGQKLGRTGGAFAGMGAGMAIGAAAGAVIGGPVGAILGAAIGGTIGGIAGILGGGKGKEQRMAERHAYQDNVLTPFLNRVVEQADPNSLDSLMKARLQAARGMKGNGSRGMQLKRDAIAKIDQLIKDLRKRIEEITEELDRSIDELARPLKQRGIVPEIRKTLDDLKEKLKMGVDPNRIFEFFNLSIRDQLTTLQEQLDDTVKQLNEGAENDQGELISLAKSLSDQVDKIQKDMQSSLESIRESFAGQASAIIGEGRTSAIIPSAATRQQRLAILSQKQRKEEVDLQTQTTNAILRATNETNREIADLQKDANTTLERISLLLSTAIGLGPTELTGFSTAFLESLQSFVNQFNPFKSLSLVPVLDGGIGITIDKLVLPEGMNATEIGQAIVDAIAQARQNQLYQRTAQQA